MLFKQSDSFSKNRFFWKIFGLWPGNIPNNYYKYYSFIYVLITLVAYNILLTLNLFYTPRKIGLLIREVIFLFTEIAVSVKVFMILLNRKKIVAIFNLLDCKVFLGNDDTGTKIIKQHNSYYKMYFSSFTILSHFTYLSLVFFPLIGLLFFKKTVNLPICQYYFLSNETKSDYLVYIFIYQSVGMYGHMMCNITSDTLIAGFIVLAIAQVKVLGHKLQNLKIEKDDTGHRELKKLHKCVEHYILVLKLVSSTNCLIFTELAILTIFSKGLYFFRYCREFQGVISVAMFVQFGVGSAIICVIMCGMLLPSTVMTIIFMVGYFIAMSTEILVPAWLGTQLSYESRELMVAAYKSDWIPRSTRYKRSLLLLVERAKFPIVITGLKMFPLTLSTYISIMKMAYSCFTLVRYFLDRQEHI